MRLPDQFRSTAFRLAVGYSLLFFVSVMAMLGVTYIAATSEVEGIVRGSIEDDLGRLRALQAREGDAALRTEVESLAAGAPDDRFYLLIDAAGRAIAGNLSPDTWHSGWEERKLSSAIVEASHTLKRAAAQNSDGEVRLYGIGIDIGATRLLVARNSHILDETQEIILAALLWGSLVTTMMALGGGYLVSLGPTRRVDAIADTMRVIVGGHFQTRLQRDGRGDELDRLSADINGMLDRIEVLMSSLKQVSTDIAHDLRTPLARMRQGLERARRTARSGADYESAVDGAIFECDGIIETFNALLRIAQIEAGARKAKFAEVDLSALLHQLFEVFESVAEDSGHRMSVRIEPDLRVLGDRDLLTQLFSNLIENAVTHVPAPAHIRITGERRDGLVVAGVADDGPGVPEAERAKIFRRLYRLDSSRTTPGNGLGLALAEAIAELHDAPIKATDAAPGLRIDLGFPAL